MARSVKKGPYLDEKLSKKIEVQSTICGICINVCPWTQKYISQEQKS